MALDLGPIKERLAAKPVWSLDDLESYVLIEEVERLRWQELGEPAADPDLLPLRLKQSA